MTLNAKGSDLRDRYKYEHKQFENYRTAEDRNKCQGLDIDFLETRNYKPVAFTGIKRFGEELTYLETKIYPFLNRILPVLIIEVDNDLTEFNVKLYGEDTSKKFTREQYFTDFLPNLQTWIKKLQTANKLESYAEAT